MRIKLPALRPTMLLIGTAAVLAACGGSIGGYVLPPRTGTGGTANDPARHRPGTHDRGTARQAAVLRRSRHQGRPGRHRLHLRDAPSRPAALTVAGVSAQVPAHCLVKGKMNERTGPVDGQTYAIGFEMRLPVDWNGRFFYQANGGLDGSVVTATGGIGGGGPRLDRPAHGLRRDQLGCRPPLPDAQLRPRPAGAPGLRLQRRRPAHADGQEPDRQGLRPRSRSLVPRRLLQRRPARDGRGLALRGPVRRHPGRRPGLQPAAGGRGAALRRAAIRDGDDRPAPRPASRTCRPRSPRPN